MFWIIKTRTGAALTDVYSSESLRLFRTIMRTYYSENQKHRTTVKIRELSPLDAVERKLLLS